MKHVTPKLSSRSADTTIAGLVIIGLLGTTWSSAEALEPADWPQWRGPERTGVSADTELLQEWPEGGPPLAWRATGIGAAMAAVAVADGRIYANGDVDGVSWLFVLREADGELLWKAEIGKGGSIGAGGHSYPGPRGTPTVDRGLVFVLGQQGEVVAFSTSGDEVWRTDLVEDHGGVVPRWGYSESPLVDGERVVVTPGGSSGVLLALDRRTGRPLWQSTGWAGEEAQYSSPIVATIGGVRQYIQQTAPTVGGVAAEDGRVLWKASRPEGQLPIATPIERDGLVLVSNGYGVGSHLFRVTAPSVDGAPFTTELVYSSKDLKNHHGGIVLLGEHVYGSNDPGILTAMHFATGEVAWRDRSIGKGSISIADGRIYLRSEKPPGTVALIEATPDGYREISTFTPPEGSGLSTWAHPVIAGGRLYLRDQETLLAYDVRAK